jgi:hypothetical protein
MTETAITRASTLLSPDTIVSASSSAADDTHESMVPQLHLVSIPAESSGYIAKRDCTPTPDGACVVGRLLQAYRGLMLPDGLVGTATRRALLQNLIHLIADVHQPLNCIDNADRNGHDVQTLVADDLATISSDLHALWEDVLVRRRGMTEDAYAAYLIDGLKREPVPESGFAPAAWANECHRVALDVAYGYPEFAVRRLPAAPVVLDATYVGRAQRAIDRQLQLAGIRLARALNTVYR